MNNTQIIQKLESSNSRLFKEEVLLNEMKKGNVPFFDGLTLTYNRLLTFGVKKIPESLINTFVPPAAASKFLSTVVIRACPLHSPFILGRDLSTYWISLSPTKIFERAKSEDNSYNTICFIEPLRYERFYLVSVKSCEGGIHVVKESIL